MAAAPLTSNHVNYLIWRYLQESGHDRTAARLQRDWKIGDPETLPFAQHIKTHALVSLVQKGLQYHELEDSLQQNGDRISQTPATLFFGTESADAPPKEEEPASNLKAPASPSKRGRESFASSVPHEASATAPASKRRRGLKDAARATPTKSSDEMEVDHTHSGQADESKISSRRPSDNFRSNGSGDATDTEISEPPTAASAMEKAPAPAPIPVKPTLESGRSILTQTDLVTQIGKQNTRLIEMGAGKRALKTVWNPQHPNLLASAGDGVCRIWSVPSAATGESNIPANGASATDTSATQAPHQYKLFESGGPGMEMATITAIAWTPDGDYLAAARTPEDLQEASAVSIFDRTGAEITQMGKGQRFFFGLAFNPSGNLLLGYGADNSHYSDESRDFGLCVWELTDDDPETSSSTAHRQIIEGAAWIDDKNIIVCGQGYIATTVYDGRSLQELQELPLENARGPDAKNPWQWSFMEYDRYTGTCILADEGQGQLGLLSADRKTLKTTRAHESDIRGVQYQPLPQHGSSGQGPRLAATASADGNIKLWDVSGDAIVLQRVFQCNSLDPARQPALAMQFSPDGGTLAVATTSKVYFWRPEKPGAWPSAEWNLDRAETGWRDGLPLVKDELDADKQVNGVLPAGANGVNGHAQLNGVSSSTSGPFVNEADRTDADPHLELLTKSMDDHTPTPTIAWSAMGKKIAYGSGEQIAVADFVTLNHPQANSPAQ